MDHPLKHSSGLTFGEQELGNICSERLRKHARNRLIVSHNRRACSCPPSLIKASDKKRLYRQRCIAYSAQFYDNTDTNPRHQ